MDDDPFDELRRGLGGDVPPDRGRPRAGVRHAIAGAGAAVLLAVAIVVVTASRPTKARTPAPAPSIAMTDAPSDTSTTATSAVARVWPAEPVDVVGNEVRTAGHRWSIGSAGDVVAVGDWDCDGTATPAVLRARTGRLHIFDTWAPDHETITASPGPTVPDGAIGVEARGCGTAAVRTADGQTLTIKTTRADR